MTLSIAWIRDTGGTSELVMASDSRLTGGGNIDHCQKVFPLPREDCCISFAGSTLIAYPFILQLQNTITEYKKMFDRAVDITKLRGRVLFLINRFIGSHEGTVPEDFEKDLASTSFLFGGWSWKMSKFYIWRIYYDKQLSRYVAADTGVARSFKLVRSNPVQLAFVGDYIPEFLQRIEIAIQKKLIRSIDNGEPVRLSYEPLNVLATMLLDDELTDRKKLRKGLIGGGPQVTKVYPFSKALTYAVEWQQDGKFVYVIRGRPIPDFENFTLPGIDPFSGKVSAPVRVRADTERAVTVAVSSISSN